MVNISINIDKTRHLKSVSLSNKQKNNTTTYGNPGHGLHRIGTKIRPGWERNPYLFDNLHVNDKIDVYKKQ